jgi:hypothetical protein
MNPQELLSIVIFKTSFLHWPRPSFYYAFSSGLSEYLKVHTQPHQHPWCLILILPPLNFPLPIYLSSGILFSLPVPIAVFYCGAYKGTTIATRIKIPTAFSVHILARNVLVKNFHSGGWIGLPQNPMQWDEQSHLIQQWYCVEECRESANWNCKMRTAIPQGSSLQGAVSTLLAFLGLYCYVCAFL